jgi:hypothetical protein
MMNLKYVDLSYNPLNAEAYATYLPLIEANNPGVYVRYDRVPEPLLSLWVLMGLPIASSNRKQRRLTKA